MSFIVYPAIDIRGGKCVRLLQGDYNQETVYGEPLQMAKKWVEEGAAWLHLVDLDGAKEGTQVNREIITGIARQVDVPIQVGGGLRTMEAVDHFLQNGISRVIIGTAAIQDKAFTERVLDKYGNRVAIGIDARNGYVATHGWLETSEVRAEELARELKAKGAETFIYTDISRDGTLQGPNVEGNLQLAQQAGVSVIASGGVSRPEDIDQLASHVNEGISGVIVGKALYTGNVSLKDVMEKLGG
ncbi:MAG: 1-(5-phosphoribosyl)-5-[(5-phosphoribosylamino)methylideneamino]imidazole-4-carboxamide isomerase [Bacillaceae bacterium]|nr:1-(5-phosphoribosyl)-5-[(5-phosphoribosylamino)methylideneamino]imidazole-4-carboxamide isomerase [Bacillaceae bacterium]